MIHILEPVHSDMNGPLVIRAVMELCESGFGTVITMQLVGRRAADVPLLIVDGDPQQGGRVAFRTETGLEPDFHLVATDLDIESGMDRAYSAADLQLLKDGIEATCTVTDGPTPRFHCPCTGS